MGKSELQTAYADWSKRVAKYEAAGIPNTVWAPIAQHDLSKTYTAGSQPMTAAEADVAVYSAWKGQSGVQESPRHAGGILGGLETVAGNIIPDIGNIITSLPRGIADLGKELVTPSTYSNTAKDLGDALHQATSGHLGTAAQDIGKSPLLDLIPGVADVSTLASPGGVTKLEEHPVTAALDVLPIGKGASTGAGIALGIEKGAEGAAGALRAGEPFSAAIQGIDARYLGGKIGETKATVLDRLKLDAKNKALSTALNQGKLAGQSELAQFSSKTLKDTFKELGDDPDKLVAFSEKASVGDVGAMTPEERVVYDKAQVIRANLEDRYTSVGDLVRTEEGLYPRDSAVVKNHNLRDRQAAKYDKATTKLSTAQERLANAQGRQATAVAAAQQVMSLMHAAGSTIKAVDRDKSLRSLSRANTEVRRAQVNLGKAQRAVKDTRNLVKSADEKLQRSIMRNPPAHLHERIKQDYRKRIAAAYTDKTFPDGIPTTGVADARVLSEYNQVIKAISTTPIQDKFYDYVGKDEAKALLNDSINEALKLAKDGLAPLYFHRLREADMASIMNVHLARDKDMPEAQVKKRAFNIESSVMNVRAGLTAEMRNIIRRDGMQVVYDKALAPHQKTLESIHPIYQSAAERLLSKGRRRGVSVDHLSMELLRKEWSEFSFDQYGIQRPGTVPKGKSIWIPKSMADNLQNFVEGGRSEIITSTRGYQAAMKVFRTSVLYGPRHFAHVVIGGIMPLLLDDPFSITQFPQMWEMFKTISQGKAFTGQVNGIEIPAAITSHFNYKEDASYKILQTKVGNKYAAMLQDFWNKTGARPGRGLAQIENAAQSLYQASVYLRDIKKGQNPMLALEHARNLVVNLDTMSPFERTILKQVFPFYSFTRFATKFLVQLPFDHPLRVSILSQLSTQAQQEWGTGLPQTMMSLFFIGHPNAKGDITTINFRNMNPFRSVSNMFTLAGFMSSLNPVISAPFVAAGFNTLAGTSQLYPEIVYDAQTGGLVAAHPKGDLMMAAEQFVPELGGLDALFGISDNLRTLKAADQGAFDREIMNMFNIPFAVSQYNMPQTRGRIAENAYKGAQNAVTAFKKTGDYSGTIGRYDLVPYNGQLIPPQQFAEYWNQETKKYAQAYPGAYTGALIPKTTTPTSNNVLSELESFYGNKQ